MARSGFVGVRRQRDTCSFELNGRVRTQLFREEAIRAINGAATVVDRCRRSLTVLSAGQESPRDLLVLWMSSVGDGDGERDNSG